MQHWFGLPQLPPGPCLAATLSFSLVSLVSFGGEHTLSLSLLFMKSTGQVFGRLSLILGLLDIFWQ